MKKTDIGKKIFVLFMFFLTQMSALCAEEIDLMKPLPPMFALPIWPPSCPTPDLPIVFPDPKPPKDEGSQGYEKNLSSLIAELESQLNQLKKNIKADVREEVIKEMLAAKEKEIQKQLDEYESNLKKYLSSYDLSEEKLKEKIDEHRKFLVAEEEKKLRTNPSKEMNKEILERVDEIYKKEKEAIISDPEGLYAKIVEEVNAYTEYKTKLAAELAGDPVRTAYGEYADIQTDFTTKNNKTDFSIVRYYRSIPGTKSGSMGKNWYSSLDMRLIRGVPLRRDTEVLFYTDKINQTDEKLKEIQRYLDENKSRLNELGISSSNYIPSEEKRCLEEQKTEYEKILLYNKTLNRICDLLTERNVFSSFGDLESVVLGRQNIIAFQDETGIVWHCLYDGSKYKPLGENANTEFYIYPLGEDGSVTSDELGNTGYRLQRRDGSSVCFDYYGLPQWLEDGCGNRVSFYRDGNGRIKKIITSCGEEILIERNASGFVTSVESVSETVNFAYSGNFLSMVTDADGRTTDYSYDSEGNLSCIDCGYKTEIEYNGKKEKKTVCQVKTPQVTENFVYDRTEGTMLYFRNGTEEAFYRFGTAGEILEFRDRNSNHTSYVYDTKGNLVKVMKNGSPVTYEYDSNGKCTYVVYSDGTSESFIINDDGMMSEHTDTSGWKRYWHYDTKGNNTEIWFENNLIFKAEYNENGLPAWSEARGVRTVWDYDRFGRIVKEINTETNFGNENESYEKIYKYDTRHRITEISDSFGRTIVYEYSKNGKKILYQPEHLLIEEKYDDYNRLVARTESDTVSGRKKAFTYEYDDRGNVESVFLNGIIIESFTYDSYAHPITEIKWNYSYFENEKLYEQYAEKYGFPEIYGKIFRTNYDSRGVPVKKTAAYVLNREGTMYGSEYIVWAEKSSGVKDGSSEYENRSGETKISNADYEVLYNELGQLEQIKDGENLIHSFIYDGFGRLREEIHPSYSRKQYYDSNGQLSRIELKDTDGNLCYKETPHNVLNSDTAVKNAWGSIISETYGDYSNDYIFDAFERCILRKAPYGESRFVYGIEDKPVLIIYDENTYSRMDYNPLGEVEALYEDGVLKGEYNYDAEGKTLVSKTYPFPRKNVSYDNEGNLLSVEIEGQSKREYSQVGNILNITDERGNRSEYETDGKGRVTRKPDRLGNTETFSFDGNGRLVSKNDAEGHWSFIEYDDKKNEVTKLYSDGNRYSVKKNPAGKIVSHKSPSAEIGYDYDLSGNLTSCIDYDTGIHVEYVWDENGRCKQKKSEYFDYRFIYDKKGNVQQISEEKTGQTVTFTYDLRNRETNRIYSSGVKIKTGYAKNGLVNYNRISDSIGQTISEKIFLYNDSLQKICEYEREKGFSLYYYDGYGRISKVVMPYLKELAEEAAIEVAECGGNIPFEKSDLSDKGQLVSFISPETDIMIGLNALCNLYDIELPFLVNQASWVEEYRYTESASLLVKKNPLAEIYYTYDAENRLLSKKDISAVNGMNFTWNKNGCLTAVSSRTKSISFSYTPFLRPELMITRDYSTGIETRTAFEYDALGRRVVETVNNLSSIRYFYDGVTTDLLFQTPLYVTGDAAANYGFVAAESVNPLLYRTPYKVSSEKDESCYDSFMDNPVFELYLYHQNEKLAVMTSEGTGSMTFRNPVSEKHIGRTDLIFDSRGECISNPQYTIWGMPVADESFRNCSFSGAENTAKNPVVLYNLGFRDYLPMAETFISPDPQKSGENAFAYCAGDPVNFCDRLGLYKNSLSPSENENYKMSIMEYLLCINDHVMSERIPAVFDCADTATYLSIMVELANGITPDNSAGMKQMYNELQKGDANAEKRAKWVINSEHYFNQNFNVQDNARYTMVTGNVPLSENVAKLAAVLDVGSGIVFKGPGGDDPAAVRNGTASGWIGHVVTVLARQFDENGNVVGFSYIQGHTNGSKDVGYTSLEDLFNGVWQGQFVGCFEIESAQNTRPKKDLCK